MSTEEEKKKKELRQDPRAVANWRVRIVNREKQQFLARTINISVGGIKVEVNRDFAMGENFFLEIAANHNGEVKTIQVVGTVTYAVLGSGGLHHIGFKFATDTSEFKGFIKRYVSDKLGLD